MIFCAGAIILHYSPFSTKAGERGRLLVRMTNIKHISTIEELLPAYCTSFNEVQIIQRTPSEGEEEIEVEFAIELKVNANKKNLTDTISNIDGINRTRITVKDILEEN